MPASEDQLTENDEINEKLPREELAKRAFATYCTTRFVQAVLKSLNNQEFKEFNDFDITSVTTFEQWKELNEKLRKIIGDTEIKNYIESFRGSEKGKVVEERLYSKLKEEVKSELKKDSDRILNAHKIFVALEKGNLDELMQDEETLGIMKREYDGYLMEQEKTVELDEKDSLVRLVRDVLTSTDPKLDEMCWIRTTSNYSDLEEGGVLYRDKNLDQPITIREAILSRLTGRPFVLEHYRSYGPHDYEQYYNEIIPFESCSREQQERMKAEALRRSTERSNNTNIFSFNETKRKD